MKNIFKIYHLKLLYIFFIFLSLNIFFFSTVKSEGKAFDINNILPVDTDQYPTNAKRPKSSVLDNSLIKTVFMLKFEDWKTELRKL